MKVSKKLPSVSFFCPAYNDEGNLPELIPVVVDFLSKNSEVFEIIILEDHSPDRTAEVADDLAQRFPEVRVFHHQKNMGYSATLKEGFESAKYEYVMYTDGDNQYNIFDFEPYLTLLENHDVITGYAIKKAVSTFRMFQSWVHNMLVNTLFLSNFRDINCAMKVFRKSVLDKITINSSPRGAFIGAELIIKAKRMGYKVGQFPVVHYERKSGISSGSKPSLVFNTIMDMIRLKLGLL